MLKNLSFISFISIFLLILSTQAEEINNTNSKGIKYDAYKIQKNARLINLDFNSSKKNISLDNPQLIEDDAPAIGLPQKFWGIDYRTAAAPWQESLRKGIVIKKILILKDPRAWSGQLLFFGEEQPHNIIPLHISINGYEIIRLASEIGYPYATEYNIQLNRWYYVNLPIGALKKGANEILMWTDSDSLSWKICISINEDYKIGSLTRKPPNRSMKSMDGGKTWSDSKLGVDNSVDGEYDVRFSLKRYVTKGKYVSPVMDIVADSSVLKRNISSLESKLYLAIDAPKATNANAMVRFGSSPLLSDSTDWTPWEHADINSIVAEDLGTKRYFQWKAELTTDNPLVSPLIKGLHISSKWKDDSPNSTAGVIADVIHNGKVITPSYAFTYENLNNPKLLELRKTFQLDKIVAGAKTEFQKMMKILNWAYRIPIKPSPYDWNANKMAVFKEGPNGSPLLQNDYKGRRRDGFCAISNTILQGALMSFGYQVRYININSESVSGHEVTEVWSNEFNKWIYMDATRDSYYFDLKTGLPMNLLEIHNKLAEEVPEIETWQKPFALTMGSKVVHKIKIGMRQGEDPQSIIPDGYHVMELMGYFRIMLRNNFYSQPYPIPVAQGYTMWGWNGYLNHYDAKFPKRVEFQRQSDRFMDFYSPLNQSQVFLSETDKQGELKVDINTFTPGFKTFLVRVDDGKWTEEKKDSWIWNLNAGMNEIETRVETAQKILGPISSIIVTYNP